MASQITIYLNEADEHHRRPLYLAILNLLHDENVFCATCYHAVAGYTGKMRVKTASLVDAGGKLPVVVTFVDLDEVVNRVLPKIQDMAPHRLIVREQVEVVQGFN